MAKRKNDTLRRNRPTREYRKVFWLSAEGQTEKDYFSMEVFRKLEASVRFPKSIHPSRTNPAAVLKRFQKALRESKFRAGDEAWLIVDVDEWTRAEFGELLKWSKADKRHRLAVSNPKFELFLVMHFESGNGCTTSSTVDAHLNKHMPNYRKRLGPKQFAMKHIKAAVKHARDKRVSSRADLPEAGMTDVYKLTEILLEMPA